MGTLNSNMTGSTNTTNTVYEYEISSQIHRFQSSKSGGSGLMALCWRSPGNCALVSDMFTSSHYKFTSSHYELITSSGLSVWTGWDMQLLT